MILGVGTDICEIARIEKALENPRFLDRWFTSAEKEYILARGAASAAGIFAAKEAVSKALGTGFSGFGADKIEILHDAHGKPVCRLHDGAKDRAEAIGAGEVMVSISHDVGMAVAFALAQTKSEMPAKDHPTEEFI